MSIVTVLCPSGVGPGQPISITHPQTGQRLEVLVPPGVTPGTQFQVQLPPATLPTSQPIVAIGVPVGPMGYAPTAAPTGYAPTGAPPGYQPSAPALSAYQGPDIRSSKEQWFQFHDRDASGGLDRREIENALIATFGVREPSRQAEIRGAVEACWGMFDYDYNGVVSRAEFLRSDGLADTIIANIRYP
jgi:hypothetical protein